ncbi:MAG: N-acetyl-gamma-glutamyl-phosphate reductase [Ruminococcaceae bacterium]|nr:N-acetyl-gamma-glutamyl-phosphate reductase [Oscillospiraceae bacterium]
MKKIFIDGRVGTTGLRIYERLESREDIELISLSEELRKDPMARAEAINSSDVSFLCLPDAAAVEAVGMVTNPDTVIIDTSTAHRTNPQFAYGFPELSSEFEDKIRNSKRIAVPGCHASGFIALVHPLVKAGIIKKDLGLSCHSLTGYSGGGKKMIAEYESDERSFLLGAPRQYGLGQEHKHLREMKAITELENAPLFCPIVADFYSGMLVTVPIFAKDINGGIDNIREIYKNTYNTPIVKYNESMNEEGFMSAAALTGRDSMEVGVYGNNDRMILVARYDNLGKGASGAAIENLNIVLGCEKALGLEI